MEYFSILYYCKCITRQLLSFSTIVAVINVNGHIYWHFKSLTSFTFVCDSKHRSRACNLDSHLEHQCLFICCCCCCCWCCMWFVEEFVGWKYAKVNNNENPLLNWRLQRFFFIFFIICNRLYCHFVVIVLYYEIVWVFIIKIH